MDRTPTYAAFVPPLKERTSEEVIELAELAKQACELFDHPLWSELFYTGRMHLLNSLVNQGDVSHGDVARKIGWLGGITLPHELAKAVIAEAERVTAELKEMEAANA